MPVTEQAVAETRDPDCRLRRPVRAPPVPLPVAGVRGGTRGRAAAPPVRRGPHSTASADDDRGRGFARCARTTLGGAARSATTANIRFLAHADLADGAG